MTRLRLGFKTSPQGVDWATVDAAWRRAGELGVFDTGWLNDHLTDMDPALPGPSLESLTLLGTLVHHVPGVVVGHAVLSNTFRHPVVLAKAATLLDHATGGRFVLGLGAGWFENEHGPFGIELPPIGERIDRLVSAVEVLRALFSDAASSPPGVTRPDRFYPLDGATNLPPPLTTGGPPLYLGGQGPRGIRLAARVGAGWILPGVNAGDSAYLATKRDELLAAMEAIDRDAAGFDIVGQVTIGATADTRRVALDQAVGLVRAGATQVVLGVPASSGPAGIEAAAAELVTALRDAFG